MALQPFHFPIRTLLMSQCKNQQLGKIPLHIINCVLYLYCKIQNIHMIKYTINEVLSFAEDLINQKVPEAKLFDISLVSKQGEVLFIEIKNGTNTESFTAFYKQNITTQTSQSVFNKIVYSKTYNLLITNILGNSLVDKAVREKVQFIDMAGNLHLNIGSDFFLLTGSKLRQELITKSLRTEIHFAWQKIIFYLLNFPGSLHYSLRKLAGHVKVSHSSIQQLEAFLIRKMYLVIHDGKKNLEQKFNLFNIWIENYNSKLSEKISFGKFKIEDDRCLEMINGSGEDYLLSGTSALSIFNNKIGFNDIIVYSLDPESLVQKYSLRRDPEGNIELRMRFWKDFSTLNPYGIVPILLFVTDLMNSSLELGRKIGTQYFEMYLADVLKDKEEYSLQNFVKYFKELV